MKNVWLWLEGIQLRPEMNNDINVLPIRLCLINVNIYTYPKPTPYRNYKIVIIVVQCDNNYAVLMCAWSVAPYVSPLALTNAASQCIYYLYLSMYPYLYYALEVCTLLVKKEYTLLSV